jgi:hypothetical protein
MSEVRKYAVTVHHNDGVTVTTLHLSTADEETKLRQIALDLNLVIDDHGFTVADPDIRQVTIRHALETQHHH